MIVKITFEYENISEVVATHFMPLLKQYPIFAFKGPLGAGKTTLIKEILAQCGVRQDVTSPTFGYVNTYQNEQGETFHHFDLYRISDQESFVGLGFCDYLEPKPNTLIFIEWPEVIASLLEQEQYKMRVCSVHINYADSKKYEAERVLSLLFAKDIQNSQKH